MLRFLFLAASFLSAAPAYWTQKSVGPNPVAPFTLARTDTIIARQVHDTADSVRAYARARIHDTAGVLRDSLARRGTESTGLWYFPAPYISIASPTTFSVAPVRGQVVNTTGSPGLTRVKIVNFAGVSGVTPTDLTTAPITYLLLDSNGALVQQPTVPTLADVASNIYLGSVNHPGLTTITSVAVAPDVASRPQDQLNGLWKGIGYINRGVTAYPNGANLSLNISGGDLYGDGIGWVNNAKTPVTTPVGPYVQVSMRLRTRSSTTSASTLYIDPANWDNGGTLTAVGGGINSATNQRIYITPAGQVIVAYGQQVYGSLAAAVAGLGSETFVVDPVTNRNLQLLGTLSVIRTATALNNTAQAIILNASKFGELSAGSAGTATTTMQGVYDNSTPPQILTDATRGALTIKRGSASDTNAVIAVQNGAGTTTARINGDGSFTGSMPFANLTSKPTTLSGYGITDAQPLDADLTAVAALTGTGYAKRTATTPTWTTVASIPDADIASASTWNAKLSTVTADATSRAANTFYAAPNGSAGAATFRTIVAADIPLLDASKINTGTLTVSTSGSAATLTSSRGISATGDASWSVSFNGGANVSAPLTLASIITAGGPVGSASTVPVITYDAKGRLTAVSTATITPAAIGALPLAGGTMNTGAQILTNKDITPSASSNTNYAAAPLVAQRASNSGTTTVAAVGFHNPGVNAAALYYDAAASVFRYNRHTGDIVTIWDASNLTNLSQLANGPGYVTNTTVANVDVTEHSANNINYPVVWDNGARYLFHTASKLTFNPALGSLISPAISATTLLAWPGASFRDYTDTNYTALYGSLAGTPGSSNYTFAIAKNGSEVYVAGSSNANLVVGPTIIARATSAGLAVTGALSATGLSGTGTRIATTNASGALGAASGITIDGGQHLTATGSVYANSLFPTVGTVGITNGTSAGAGYVGQRISSVVSSASPTNINSTSATSVASITLGPGEWLIFGTMNHYVNMVSSQTAIEGCINTSVAMRADGYESKAFPGTYGALTGVMPVGGSHTYSNSSTTSYYMVAKLSAVVDQATAWGHITAIRIR